MKFNLPKIHSRYIIESPWKFGIVPDHINSGFCSYFLGDGLGMGIYNSASNQIVLPEETIIEVIDFSPNRMIFNLIKLAGKDINSGYFGEISFWVSSRELDKLVLKDLA